MSRTYWTSLRNMSIKKNISYATKQFAILNVSRKRALKQSEEFYLKFVTDPNNQDVTHVRVCFEYLGDSLIGTESGMEKTVNDWIILFNVEPIKFQRKPMKENEIFFIDAMEEAQIHKKGDFFCPFCGKKLKSFVKYCPECGSKLDM
ncbi:MAG: zinc ribbon domain-containing protein [Promethearchaeota archaeon]